MPATLTYPGVYIEEIPSGVRSIAGVATSIAAFAGWTARGDTDRATLVQSWAGFERQFGGFDLRSPFAHSVYHFFNNGGQQAYIIRLAAADAVIASVDIGGVLRVQARNAGKWATNYAVSAVPRTDKPERFNLTVYFVNPDTAQNVVVESFDNLSMSAQDPRYFSKVLEAESGLVRVAPIGSPVNPPNVPVPAKLAGVGNLDGTVLEPNTGAFETALTAAGVGIHHLERVDLFNLLCVPGETTDTVIQDLEKFCRDHRAFLIADCEQGATLTSVQTAVTKINVDDGINAAFYFPWVRAPDPMRENRIGEFPPSGFVAGLYAKTDATRGVWKAPAGVDAALTGVAGLRTVLTDDENGTLNIKAINCLRNFRAYGNVVWGARTLRGANEVGSEWKYVPVFRQGALQGSTPREAYFVKCDNQTTTQSDINLGIVNIHVGFAPLKPAEFVVIRIQQIAGQIQA
jgi:Bacteriophage tail sheath protein